MTEARKPVRLYEALELRAEYDARIKTLRDCLPESRQNRGLFSRDSDSSRRPAPGFSVSGAREQLRALEYKRRKLNAAIQRANFEHRLEHEGDDLSLTEALETRKALNERLGELHSQVVDSAYEHVLHKGGAGHRRGERAALRGLPRPPGRGAGRVPPAQPAAARRLLRGRGGVRRRAVETLRTEETGEQARLRRRRRIAQDRPALKRGLRGLTT